MDYFRPAEGDASSTRADIANLLLILGEHDLARKVHDSYESHPLVRPDRGLPETDMPEVLSDLVGNTHQVTYHKFTGMGGFPSDFYDQALEDQVERAERSVREGRIQFITEERPRIANPSIIVYDAEPGSDQGAYGTVVLTRRLVIVDGEIEPFFFNVPLMGYLDISEKSRSQN